MRSSSPRGIPDWVSIQEELRRLHAERRVPIRARLRDFAALGREASDRELFSELAFCVLTPQTSARACDAAVAELVRSGRLYSGAAPAIARTLHHRVRFHNHKARYLLEARKTFTTGGHLRVRQRLEGLGPTAARSWLLANLLRLWLKDATHFLRNIGRSGDLAILDRHILRNLREAGALRSLPRSLTPAAYLRIEERFAAFARSLLIPPAELDLLLWSKETGEIFK